MAFFASMNPSTTNPRVAGIFAFDGALASGITGLVDVLRLANTIRHRRQPQAAPLFDPVIVAERAGRITLSNGLEISARALAEVDPDELLVGGLDYRDPGELVAALKSHKRAIRSVAEHSETPVSLCCTASFLVADSGVLDGRTVATSWWLVPLFRRSYPNVLLDSERILVRDGHIVSAGGVTSFFDVALEAVERHGGEDLRKAVASVLVLERERNNQATFVSQALMDDLRTPFAHRVDRVIQNATHTELTVSELARRLNTSDRTLLRHFKEEFGTTPRSYLRTARLNRAKMLLETSAFSIDQIGEKCGYTDSSAFRKSFARQMSMSPSEYRRRFALRR